MVLFFPNTLTNEGPVKPKGNIIDRPDGDVEFSGDVYKTGPLKFYIDNTLIQTLDSSGVDYHVDHNIDVDFKVTGDLLLSIEDSQTDKGKLVLTDTFTNRNNYIQYKESNTIDITTPNEGVVELNTPDVNVQNRITMQGELETPKIKNDTELLFDIDDTEKFKINGSTIETSNDLLIKKSGHTNLTLHSNITEGGASSANVIMLRGQSTTDDYVDIYLENGPDFRIKSSQVSVDRTLATFGWDTGDLDILRDLNATRNVNCVDVTASGDVDCAKVTASGNVETSDSLKIFEGTTEQLRIYHNSTANANYLNSKNSHPLIFDINNTEIFRADTDGLKMNGSNDIELSTLNVRSNGGIYALSNSDLDFYTSSAKRMIIESNGNVTVGNISQSGAGEQLTVIGSIKCDNVYTTKGIVDAGEVDLDNAHYIKIDGNTTLNIGDSSFKYSDNHHCDILNTSSTDSTLTFDLNGITTGVNTTSVYVNDTAVDTTVSLTYDYTFKKKSKLQFWIVSAGSDNYDIYIHTMS